MCFYLSEISEYLQQYTRLEVNSIKDKVSENLAYALYHTQFSDTSAEALLLGCDAVCM